ncbi:UDP-N-acetylmuramyl pentapeptide phosphotransferase/UDP-N-acetylglucosamine-1-phosphate transferase [Leptolyngbya sp. BL0902]|uniref:MraY family glycosyltransferase n=1 Tax=Leptolyngbya sp. BL0902 TaxID=1115757 RepID=UPI0018E8E506|nr:glycosyltransferase family 4 protein [Leptolyngbya sp. BL0902]QQE65507.1 UDP-N-acetylmuramyl pentapeptide phosphotransferase/UDP-N-acetylglucosamine-1-phosphate transferase [Leptolyngbya sp. BL0902]
MPLLLLLTALLSALLVNFIRQRLRAQLLDIPNHRSSHTVPTPRGGGLGFWVAFLLALALLPWLSPGVALSNLMAVVIVLLPLALIGYWDDLHSLSARTRYGVQLMSAGLAVYFFGPFPQPWFEALGPGGIAIAVVLTLIGFTTLVNLTNFMDGLDGLVGGVSLVQFAFLGWYLANPIWGLLAAALLGFLWWNWPPAKIFMGDVGSTTLGGAITLALMMAPSQHWILLALTLPITGDAIYTLFRRLLRRENIFKAHRTHVYQRLPQRGIPPMVVTLIYMGLTGLIVLLITTLGALGAGLSATITLSLIALAEGYLQRP